jgi:hypothetical protein
MAKDGIGTYILVQHGQGLITGTLLQQGYRLHKLLQTSIKFHYRYADLHTYTRYYSTFRDIKK